MSEYAADEPQSFNAIVERQPFEPPKESADPFSGSREGLQEAADEVARGREVREMPRRFVRDPDNPDTPAPADVTITAETAADALRQNRGLEAQSGQEALDAEIAREIDRIRAAQPEQPEFQQTQPQAPEVQPEFAPPESNPELDSLLQGLAPEGRAAFLNNYHQAVQQAQYQASAQYSEALQRTAAMEQQLQQGVQNAGQIAIAGLLASFPELNGINDQAQLNIAVQTLERSNPQRHQQLANHVAQVRQTIQVAQQQQQQQQVLAQQQQHQQAEAQRHQFQRFAAYHDERVAAVPPEVANEVVAMAAEHGVSKQELLELYNTSPVLRHSAFQQMMSDAAKYRLAQRNIPRAASRPVPQIQRPGVTSDAARDDNYSHIERQYRGQSLTPKQAAELVTARRARR